jgi:acyl-CoA thioester hydrolase
MSDLQPTASSPQSSAQPFRYRLRVRYGECDAQKVVFNVRYGDYVDLAVCEFLRSLGLADLVIAGPLDYQLVKQTIEWKSSARFDQVLEIAVRPKHLGTTSFSLAIEFRIAGQGAIIATAETVYVLVDAATLAKTPLPGTLRDALDRPAVGMLVDHADSSPR